MRKANQIAQISTLLAMFLLLAGVTHSKHIDEDKVFTLKKDAKKLTFSGNYMDEDVTNEFKVKLASKDQLSDQNLYILLESDTLDFYINVWQGRSRDSKTSSMKVGTFSGNALFILGKGLFRNKFKYVKERGTVYFGIKTVNRIKKKQGAYKLTVFAAKKLELPMGKTITTMIDPEVNVMDVDLSYDGSKMTDLSKLRFQLTAIRSKKDWQLSSNLSYGSQTFQLNPIFKKAIGGVLTQPKLPVCHESKCVYSMNIKTLNIRMFNLETFLISKMEKLSIQHYEDYYDKHYESNETTIYELPYFEEMEQLDISISLIPVTGNTELYINPNTIPTSLDSYAFSEKGKLAKRITVKWEELTKMKADKTSIYIAVHSSQPGEYLIKIDAHDQGFRGTLSPGIIESGLVQYNEISNYLYMFEVIETQEITFDVKLSVTSGDGDLFLYQCTDYSNCMINQDDIDTSKPGLLKVQNNLNDKDISHTFTCKHSGETSSSVCQFVVGVKGKENHGTHYELSLRESSFHRLIIPGHTLSLNIEPLEKTYVKLSFPSKTNPSSKLFMSVESLWGEFDLYLSKTEEYPSKELNDISFNSKESMNETLKSLHMLEMDPSKLGDKRVEGVYYISIEALKETSVNIKFIEKQDHQISIHTLTSGKQVRGNITHSSEIVYYSIRISLDDVKASSVQVNLTPTKGSFALYANRNGVLPSIEHNEFFTEDNRLELKIPDNKKVTEEFLIGVSLHNPTEAGKTLKGDFQYVISFSYSNKPIKLNPGTLASHLVNNSTYFLIEVLDSFNDLLVLKSIVDGFTIDMCGYFTVSEEEITDTSKPPCDYSAKQRDVSIYVKKQQLLDECKKVKAKSDSHKPRCYFMLSMSGTNQQSFRIGYTYNNKPFQLVKGHIMNGPFITDSKAQVNFIYHPEPKKELGIYFNSKGKRLHLYGRLLNGDNFDESVSSGYPGPDNNDEANAKMIGYVENLYYSKAEVAKMGDSPELLISVRPDKNNGDDNADIVFDGKNSFILETAMDCVEVLRTQTMSQEVQEGQWNYYSFYNNGNSPKIKIFVISEVSTPIQALVSQGLSSRPPITNKPIIQKTTIGSLELDVTPDDLRTTSHDGAIDMRGYYVLGVKASATTSINVYWNNKQDLNYVELTPNEPSSMIVGDGNKFYFAFYARDADGIIKGDAASIDRKDIRVYLKINVKANIYILKSPSGELDAPGPDNFLWKTSTADKGGITMVDIKSNDPNYCVECLYIGYVEVSEPGQLSILTNILHDNMPVHLKPGFSFPEYLEGHSSQIFRVFNPDTDELDLTVSLMSGFVNVYIGKTQDVSASNYDELYSLEQNLNVHKFIPISPHKYKIDGPNEWFILVDNPKAESASFQLTVDKNNIKSPIEPGVTKFIHLGPGESTDYFYKPSASESQFEIRVEIDQVMDANFVKQSLEMIKDYISLYELTISGEHLPLESKDAHATYNKVYVKFNIPSNSGKTFGIRIYNPVASAVALRTDLLNGNYKLVNFNTYNLGMVHDKNKMVYEAYGSVNKYLFVDVRSCTGHPKVSFYQSDYQNLEDNKAMKYKIIKDENSTIHYVKMEHKRVFIKVENKKGNFTSYTLNAFSEKDMDLNPYSEITQEGDGKVNVEIDSQTIKFKPLVLSTSVGKEFTNQIVYSVYLSTSLKVMRYAKNCGLHMIKYSFDDPEILEFQHIVVADHDFIKNTAQKKKSKFDWILKNGLVNIHFDKLGKNKKYYGIAIAQVNLFPVGEGFLTPVRSGKAYYDEFTIVTPRITMPIQLIISVLIIAGILMAIFCIIKSYIFGNINKLNEMGERIPHSFRDFDDENSFGFKALSLLEKAYYEEKTRMAGDSADDGDIISMDIGSEGGQDDVDDQSDENEDEGEDTQAEIELSDMNDTETPLDA